MYGTIMRGRVKAGKKAEYEEMLRARTPDTSTGFHSAELAWEDKDPDRFVAIIHFRDRDSYITNADAPSTDENYRRQLEYLDGPPEWIDVSYAAYMGQPVGERAATA